MLSYLGDTKIGKMYLGDTEVAKAYLGDTLVFAKGGGGGGGELVYYDWLVFDGTAYVQTDYPTPAMPSVLVDVGYETTHAHQNVFGWRDANGSIEMYLGGGTNNSNRQIVVQYDSPNYLAYRTLGFSYSSFTFYLTPNRYGWGTQGWSITKGSAHPVANLLIGGGYDTPFTGRLGTLRVYGSDAAGVTNTAQFDNYTPIATFRPCTYDGEAGMWHEEAQQFYGNTAGAGSLSVINGS